MVVLHTVGYGTVTAPAFASLLHGADIAAVVDVRRFPGSRRHPQFRADEMRTWLPDGGVAYRWDERLGGRRRGRPDSVNVGLRNAGFRAYADHMAQPPFWEALDAVLDEARRRSTTVLCAERLWWRCHRRLIADAAVLVRGAAVHHLLHDGRVVEHVVTAAARRVDDLVIYDRHHQGELLG